MNRWKNILKRWALALGAAAVLAVSAAAVPVSAAGGITMSTSYPGRTVSAGSTVSFDLSFSNSTGSGANTAVQTVSLPDGWTGSFTGGGAEISHVYVKSGEDTAAASYALKIPDDAEEGSYKVSLKAVGNGESAVLDLTLNVASDNAGASALTTEYAEQEGSSGTSFTFSTTVQNNSGEPQSYALSTGAPEGWTVQITPSGASTQVASIDVDAHGTQGLSIKVTPPEGVEAGDYTIPVSAVSASEKLSAELKVKITGSYGITVSGANGALSFNATANRKQPVTIDITNSGNIDLSNVNLTASVPTDWTVEFSESTIDTLAAGQTREITMYVTPSKDALSGDYEVDLTAQNDVTSKTAAFRTTVKTSTGWGIVGVVLIAAVVAGLAAVFHKFGRH